MRCLRKQFPNQFPITGKQSTANPGTRWRLSVSIARIVTIVTIVYNCDNGHDCHNGHILVAAVTIVTIISSVKSSFHNQWCIFIYFSFSLSHSVTTAALKHKMRVATSPGHVRLSQLSRLVLEMFLACKKMMHDLLCRNALMLKASI